MTNPFIKVGSRKIGSDYDPLIIAEIGINHEGSIKKAFQMVNDAHQAGAECVKFQVHFLGEEMASAAKDVIPAHTKESIWEIMERCMLTEGEHAHLKNYVEKLGMIYIATPFSKKAVDFLGKLNVKVFKIGSGECNNYPLLEYVSKFKKPIILSTGMNQILSIKRSVDIIRRNKIPFSLLHCTSLYPTPYSKVRLGALSELKNIFPDSVIGLSDHSVGIYTALGATALGASILEKHFTSSKKWKGPDIAISIDRRELKELILGSKAIKVALGGTKTILQEEKPTIKFAYSSVVSIKKISKGEIFSTKNIWVKRPGTGEILAEDFNKILGKKSKRDIEFDVQIRWKDIS